MTGRQIYKETDRWTVRHTRGRTGDSVKVNMISVAANQLSA